MERRPVLLACEDEERIVELLRALTEPLNVDLVAARDGATALAHLAARRPALMTLDLVLPNLDGFAVLERIRQRRDLDDMPIVVISAIADAGMVKRAYGLGVVDHLSSGLIVVDEKGVIVQVNAAACVVLSRKPDTLVGRSISEALPGAEPLFLVSGDASQRRVTIRTAHGERNLGFTNAAVEVNGGQGALAVFRELSEVEAARREQEERARREELASSARSFAHEVRNPLAAIGGAAQVIAREDCDKKQRMRLARAIESEADRVTRLVQEYVERREVQPTVTSVDVPLLLSEVVEVNLLTSPARERITVDAEAGLPTVKGDAARLKQVVLNLVLNAVKATDSGGTIALHARPDAGGVSLRVSDTGCGIAPADLPRIFDESFSTRQGGGLGLPIARRIIEQHGGAIRVESTEGRGTTFTVWLPAA